MSQADFVQGQIALSLKDSGFCISLSFIKASPIHYSYNSNGEGAIVSGALGTVLPLTYANNVIAKANWGRLVQGLCQLVRVGPGTLVHINKGGIVLFEPVTPFGELHVPYMLGPDYAEHCLMTSLQSRTVKAWMHVP